MLSSPLSRAMEAGAQEGGAQNGAAKVRSTRIGSTRKLQVVQAALERIARCDCGALNCGGKLCGGMREGRLARSITPVLSRAEIMPEDISHSSTSSAFPPDGAGDSLRGGLRGGLRDGFSRDSTRLQRCVPCSGRTRRESNLQELKTRRKKHDEDQE